MIHQIKALHNQGNGLSIRKIAKQLNISRNTVSKYLTMSETEIAGGLSDMDRTKKLDEYRDYIIQLLQTYPELSAVKVLRKLKAKIEMLSVSSPMIAGVRYKLKYYIRYSYTETQEK